MREFDHSGRASTGSKHSISASGRSSTRSRHSISASVTLDGLVVVNDPTIDEDDMLGLEESKHNPTSKRNDASHHQLYRVHAEQPNTNVDDGNHLIFSNHRDITSEWASNHSNRSRSDYSIDKSGRSIGKSPTRKPPTILETKDLPSNGSKANDAGENKIGSEAHSVPLDHVELLENERHNHEASKPVRNEVSTSPRYTNYTTHSTESTAAITLGDSQSSTDVKPPLKSLDTSIRSQEEGVIDNSNNPNHQVDISTRTASSEHTHRIGNHRQNKSPKRKTSKSPTRAGFSSKVHSNGLPVVNRIQHPGSLSDDSDDVEASLSTDDICDTVPSNTSSDDDSYNGSARPTGGSNPSLPSIKELEEAKYGYNTKMNQSKKSIFSDSSNRRKKMQRKSSMGSIDPRLTQNSMRSNAKELQSFYEPTTTLSQRKPQTQIRDVLKKQAELQKGIVGGRKVPAPWRPKSKRQKAREKRQKERREAKRRAIRLRQLASREEYQPLSQSFPVLKQPEEVFIRCRGRAGAMRTEVVVTTEDSEPVATLSYTQLKPKDRYRNLASGKRVLRDAEGNQCALILHTRNLAGRSTFRICGPIPMSSHHKSVDGFFVWAEVKNVGKISAQFAMTIKRDADLQGQSVQFKTRSTGSRWLACLNSEATGLTIDRKKEDGSKLGGCASLVHYRNCRGLTVNTNMDFGLMLCFALVVDEMVGNRIR